MKPPKLPPLPKLEDYDLSHDSSFDDFEMDMEEWFDEVSVKIKMVERSLKLKRILEEKNKKG